MGEVARQNKPAAGSTLPHQPHPDMLHNVNTIANKTKTKTNTKTNTNTNTKRDKDEPMFYQLAI